MNNCKSCSQNCNALCPRLDALEEQLEGIQERLDRALVKLEAKNHADRVRVAQGRTREARLKAARQLWAVIVKRLRMLPPNVTVSQIQELVPVSGGTWHRWKHHKDWPEEVGRIKQTGSPRLYPRDEVIAFLNENLGNNNKALVWLLIKETGSIEERMEGAV